MWSFTDPIWGKIFIWVTLAALILGGLTAFGAFASAIIGYKITESTQNEAALQIANLTNEAAKSNERAAVLENETAQLKEANLKLETRLAWRRITGMQRDAMVKALSPFAGAQIVLDPEGNGDPEVDTFAEDLRSVFLASNWTVRVDSGNVRIPAPVGTTCLADPKNPAASVLLEQMESAPGGCTALRWAGGLKITIGVRPPP